MRKKKQQKYKDKERKALQNTKKVAKNRRKTKDISTSQFRWVNEKLYSVDSESAKKMFADEPSLFHIYHKGYNEQLKQWPTNPLENIAKIISTKGEELIVADMGCGGAALSQTLKNKVHSFDLIAANPSVVACDIANVPLDSQSVDIVVFCLSLMGTNLSDFINEAHRILKLDGTVIIAEVASRFHNVSYFKSGMFKLGFRTLYVKKLSSHFLLFECKKVDRKPHIKTAVDLKLLPCVYKKR